MGFSSYPDSATVKGVERGKVVIGIRGSQSYQSGEYTNERNATITTRVEPETAREMIEDMEDALEKLEGDA